MKHNTISVRMKQLTLLRWPRKAKHNKKFVKTQQEICPKHNKKFAKTQQKIC